MDEAGASSVVELFFDLLDDPYEGADLLEDGTGALSPQQLYADEDLVDALDALLASATQP